MIGTSTYRGTVADLMRPGIAKPFRQPGYTPIPCAPADTGMPMGGIGNAFTLTPAGTTPALSMLNGWHITPEPGKAIRLRNLFFSERKAGARLLVADPNGLLQIYGNQPLARSDGSPWLERSESPQLLQVRVDEMAAYPGLYRDNRASLERWHVNLSQRTLSLLAKGPSARLSYLLLLDIFGSTLKMDNLFEGSLTGDVEERVLAGQPSYPSESMRHVGLYPAYATEYDSGRHKLKLKVSGFTPIITGDERACSLPVSITEVELENPTDEPLEASLVWTLENICGYQVEKIRPESQDAWFKLIRTASFQKGGTMSSSLPEGGGGVGIHLYQSPEGFTGDFNGNMALVVGSGPGESDYFVSTHPSFSSLQEEGVVAKGLRTGRVSPWHIDFMVSGRERKMGAVCVSLAVPPGAKRKVPFALVLDFPEIRLNGYASRKKYTVFYPDAERRAFSIAIEALSFRERFVRSIGEDHTSLYGSSRSAVFRSAPSTPAGDRLKTMLCNSLAFLAEGSIWDASDRFWIRECVDYPFFNSLDVYFYGSFALLRILPRLDGCVLREFARAVLSENPVLRRHWIFAYHPYSELTDPKYVGPRAVFGAVPHDMGSPFDPNPDAYVWHNVKHWKDLAPKFLLMVWRHYKQTGDKAFLSECWTAAKAALDYLADMRPSGENIPLTNGTDDTFDNLESYGVSAYCGSLWIAALATGTAIADELGKPEAREWAAWGARSAIEYREMLWDENMGYYLFYRDPRTGRICDYVFADQLLADLWLGNLGLPAITPVEKRQRIADAILSRNFRSHSPWIGAANLCDRMGRALEPFQAREAWVGIQFSLAAACFACGREADAWKLLETQYANLYDKARIPFGAPEGFNGSLQLLPEHLCRELRIPSSSGPIWAETLKEAGILDGSYRITLKAQAGKEEVLRCLSPFRNRIPTGEEDRLEGMHELLISHSLQYTAGRYLRQGMIWALCWDSLSKP